MKPVVVAVPWLTVLLLLLMLHVVGGTLVSSEGMLVDLPETDVGEGEATELVALVMPRERETLVFFDDARYLLGDENSERALGEHLADRVSRCARKTLLMLSDRRVTGGDLMRLAGILRKNGVSRILMAEKSADEGKSE